MDSISGKEVLEVRKMATPGNSEFYHSSALSFLRSQASVYKGSLVWTFKDEYICTCAFMFPHLRSWIRNLLLQAKFYPHVYVQIA